MSAAIEQFEVQGLTADSRQVAPGYLFAALPGSREDGRRYIDQAVARGAIAILAPSGTQLADYGQPILLICDDNPRRRLAQMAARYYKLQPHHIAAVTGTNGKTSVASFTREIWTALGEKAASVGTLGITPPLPDAPAALTTPDPVELMRCVAALAGDGVEHLVVEASSHGLDQYRLDGLRVTSAAFTNLSRDHLDYHGSMADYLAAKTRLFGELLSAEGTAVLNADDPSYDMLAALCRRRGQRVLSYGRSGKELRLLALHPAAGRLDLVFELFGRSYSVKVALSGTFQALNLLAALGLVLAETEASPEEVLATLPELNDVPGRAELIGETPSGGQVFVDYAHTPDALQTVLGALRPHTENRMIVVFGCGGDRDPGKRPLMGNIAGRLADLVIVTDDNPRSEDAATIRAEILTAIPEAREIGDRAAAIAEGIAELGPGDTLVIAGKGHETGQLVGGVVLPFDDRVVARSELERLRREEA